MIPWWLSASGGFILASIIALTAHNLDTDRLELKRQNDINDQKTLDQKECQDQTIPATESDRNALQTCNNNLNTCDNLLRKQPATCVPINRPASRVKTATATASGITSTTITAHNQWCDNIVDQYNNALTWAAACQKAGNCK